MSPRFDLSNSLGKTPWHDQCSARAHESLEYPAGRDAMTDLLVVLATIAFFLLAWLYTLACERLR